MNKGLVHFLFFLLLLASMSCTHAVHLVQASGFEPYVPFKNLKKISAVSEQFVVMGFAFDVNYVDIAYQKLQRQCQRGAITGVVTRYWTSHGFFSWTNKITLEGYCLQKSSS